MALDSFFVCGNISAYRSSVLPASHLVRRLLFCLFWRNTLNNLGNKVKHFIIKLKHLDGKSIKIKMTVIILEKYARFWSHNHKELLFQIQKSPWVFQDDGKKKTLERNERRNDYTIQEERKRSECREQRNTSENVSNQVIAARARLSSHTGHLSWTDK